MGSLLVLVELPSPQLQECSNTRVLSAQVLGVNVAEQGVSSRQNYPVRRSVLNLTLLHTKASIALFCTGCLCFKIHVERRIKQHC